MSSPWAHDNLVAWTIVHFDSKERGPEERAAMLARLGFKHLAYDWVGGAEADIPTFDAEIEALQRHGIDISGWLFQVEPTDPRATVALETFKRHGIAPRLWLIPSAESVMERVVWPEPWDAMSPEERDAGVAKLAPREMIAFRMGLMRQTLAKTPQEHDGRVEREADRVQALVDLAAPYGVKVALYNHGGWSGWGGMMDTQLDVLDRLDSRGVTDVGMVYNFGCAKDELHDDTADFPALWERIKDRVVALNVTGTPPWDRHIYPSQGECELELMRTIERSGWNGPVGLVGEHGGDAETTLSNYRRGVDWLAAELREPGTGGARPFSPVVSATS